MRDFRRPCVFLDIRPTVLIQIAPADALRFEIFAPARFAFAAVQSARIEEIAVEAGRLLRLLTQVRARERKRSDKREADEFQ